LAAAVSLRCKVEKWFLEDCSLLVGNGRRFAVDRWNEEVRSE
jgi:hypothetical protein